MMYYNCPGHGKYITQSEQREIHVLHISNTRDNIIVKIHVTSEYLAQKLE